MYPTNREIWKSVNGFANYEVSSFGRVRNATTERILKPGLNNTGYLNVRLYKNSKGKTHNIHKIVAQEFLENPFNLKCIDHIDGNRSNNNLDNLRHCTYTENNRNCTKRENTSSRFKGVAFRKRVNKWQAYININGRQKHLGYFLDEKDAARAYDEAAKELFKEFSKINIIED